MTTTIIQNVVQQVVIDNVITQQPTQKTVVQETVGIPGSNGVNGKDVLSGSGAPLDTLGIAGDIYFDTTNGVLYGPKTTTWGTGLVLKGTNGHTVLSGTGVPSAGLGADGDFYIDVVAHSLYGPKTSGVWGAGTSLIGPPGSGTGDVVGPSSAIDSHLAVFSGATGKLIKDGGAVPTTLPASDVYPWAKAAVKPTYTNTEVGAAATVHSHAESDVTNLTTDLSAKLPLTGGTMSGDITLGENTALALDPEGSADEKWSGITVTGTAGATLAVGDLCYLNSSWKWVLANASAASTSGSVVLGVCLTAASDTQATRMLLMGTVRSAAFPASITGGVQLYVSATAGDMTTTQPTTTDYVIRCVGWAITTEPNTIFFCPSADYITHT